MRKATSAPQVVLDTNLVLSALVFAGGRLATLRTAWQSGHCVPLLSGPTTTELLRVLAYPKFKLSADDQAQLLADYLPYGQTVRMPARLPTLPQCRDPNAQMFIELAHAGKADWLVTGDRDLLALAPSFSRPIVTADEFLRTLG